MYSQHTIKKETFKKEKGLFGDLLFSKLTKPNDPRLSFKLVGAWCSGVYQHFVILVSLCRFIVKQFLKLAQSSLFFKLNYQQSPSSTLPVIHCLCKNNWPYK
jgi:hypothetical protein